MKQSISDCRKSVKTYDDAVKKIDLKAKMRLLEDQHKTKLAQINSEEVQR
jgi:hypothetical protein